MADEQFYTILTTVGKAKVANAALLSSNVTLKTLKVGDSNGSYYSPTEDQKELRNVVYSCDVGSVKVDADNPNWIIAETIIPGSVGGFTIREIGLFDVDGDMIAVGKYPETYKPAVANGASKDLCVRTIFEVSNTESVTLSLNPSVIIATRDDINNLQKQIDENNTFAKELTKDNLIINGNFAIDQYNNFTETTATNRYFIDRWYMWTGTNSPRLRSTKNELIWIYSGNDNLIQMVEMGLRQSRKHTFSCLIYIPEGAVMDIGIYNAKSVTDDSKRINHIEYVGKGCWDNATFNCEIADGSYYEFMRLKFSYRTDKGTGKIGDQIMITDVKIENGSYKTLYRQRSLAKELMLCQRYYKKVPRNTHLRCDRYGGSYFWFDFGHLMHDMRIVPTLRFGVQNNLATESYNQDWAICTVNTQEATQVLQGMTLSVADQLLCAHTINGLPHGYSDACLKIYTNNNALDAEIY